MLFFFVLLMDIYFDYEISNKWIFLLHLSIEEVFLNLDSCS
jgi:hypothetical protein